MKKVLVLTSGGDAPGMNAAIRAITISAMNAGFAVFGAIGGYSGVINGEFKKLTIKDVENIIQLGGTIIKSSRCPEFMTDEGFNKAVQVINKNKFECVFVLGGDGSTRGALKLSQAGINVITLPCTIDNDMGYTRKSIGFDTALNTITGLLGNVRDTSSAHDRVCVIEVMGRHSGDLALYSGLSAGAEYIIVPELKFDQKEFIQKINKSINTGEKCALVVVAEGAFKAEQVQQIINDNLKVDAKSMNLGYVQRGGSPSVVDRVLATKMGYKATELMLSGNYNCAIRDTGLTVDFVSIQEALEKHDKFDNVAYIINNSLSI